MQQPLAARQVTAKKASGRGMRVAQGGGPRGEQLEADALLSAVLLEGRAAASGSGGGEGDGLQVEVLELRVAPARVERQRH